MTEVDEQHFKTMDGCHIHGENYTDKDVRVRDHCHITGKFWGLAHQECNLKLRIKLEDIKIPVKYRISMIKAKLLFFYISNSEGHGFHGNKGTILILGSVNCPMSVISTKRYFVEIN